MNRYLPNNIDDFFSGNLKNYSEEPGEDVWSEIDKRLSDNKTTRRLKPAIPVIGVAAMILVCLCMPFLIRDNFMHDNSMAQNKTNNHTLDNYNEPSKAFNNAAEMNDQLTGNIVNKQQVISTSIQNLLPEDHPVAVLSNNVNDNATKPEHLDNLIPGNLTINDLTQSNKVNEHAPASINIKLHNKHLFYLSPFFSVDHITGRFIEQYEFDNLDENDLAGREKPDMSFYRRITCR